LICVYEANCSDFSGNGLGVLTPSDCSVTETLNGEWEEVTARFVAPAGVLKIRAVSNALAEGEYVVIDDIELRQVGRFSPIIDYQGRVLTYYAKDFNRGLPKQPPSNRKSG